MGSVSQTCDEINLRGSETSPDEIALSGKDTGVAFVFDDLGDFQTRCNRELVELVRVAEHESHTLRSLVERHFELTSSPSGAQPTGSHSIGYPDICPIIQS